MNRLFVAIVSFVIAVTAYGQGAFTIRRPVDGSVVREIVRIRMPKNSIPAGGYLGIRVNGKFLEAVAPTSADYEGKDFVYKLDTKKRQIPDGDLKIEAILYVDYGDSSKEMNRSSVNLRLQNKIEAPPSGFHIRYKYGLGKEWIYRVEFRTAISSITQAQAQLGGRAGELPRDSQKFRFLYAIDNVYPEKNRKEALLRAQLLPNPGSDYVVLSTPATTFTGDNAASIETFHKKDLFPVVMRLTDTGKEIFGRAPFAAPLFGDDAGSSEQGLYRIIPLPILPAEGVRQGDTWNSGITNQFILGGGQGNAALFRAGKITHPIPAQSTLEAIEWEGGLRCARIRTVAEMGSDDDDASAQAEEVYWFALDHGFVVKIERTYTRTLRLPSGAAPAAPGYPQAPGAPGVPDMDMAGIHINPLAKGVSQPINLMQFPGQDGSGWRGRAPGSGGGDWRSRQNPGGRKSSDIIMSERTQIVMRLER